METNLILLIILVVFGVLAIILGGVGASESNLNLNLIIPGGVFAGIGLLIALYLFRTQIASGATAATSGLGSAASAATSGLGSAASAAASGLGSAASGIGSIASGSAVAQDPKAFSYISILFLGLIGGILALLGQFKLVDDSDAMKTAGISLAGISGGLFVLMMIFGTPNFLVNFFQNPDSSFQVGRVVLFLVVAAVVLGLFFGLGVESSYSKALTYIIYALLGLGAIYLLTKFAEAGVDKPTFAIPSVLFRLLYYFLPYGILMYTSLSDIFNSKFKYSGATITALITAILNSVISKTFFSNTDATGKKIPVIDANKCGIPGFASILGSNLLPQGMLFNLTSLSSLAVLITQETDRDPKYTVPVWSFVVSIFIASVYMLISGDCFKNVNHQFYFEKKFPGYGALLTVVATFAVALVAGTAGGFGIWGGLREGFAGYVDPKKEKEVKTKTGTDEVVNVSTSLAEVCPAVSGDQIVAEIYQNGEKISTTATET